MWNDSDVRSLSGLRLGGGPVQSVQNVLAKGGEEAVGHLGESNKEHTLIRREIRSCPVKSESI